MRTPFVKRFTSFSIFILVSIAGGSDISIWTLRNKSDILDKNSFVIYTTQIKTRPSAPGRKVIHMTHITPRIERKLST